jgi:hypothetical protein
VDEADSTFADFDESEGTLRLRIQMTKGMRQRIIALLDSVLQGLWRSRRL